MWQTGLPGGVPDIHYVVTDPEQPNRLYCSIGFGRIGELAEVPEKERIAGMFASDDGGQSWQHIWQGTLHRYTRPLCIDSRPPHALRVGTAPNACPYIPCWPTACHRSSRYSTSSSQPPKLLPR